MTKKITQEIKYIKNEKSIWDKIKILLSFLKDFDRSD